MRREKHRVILDLRLIVSGVEFEVWDEMRPYGNGYAAETMMELNYESMIERLAARIVTETKIDPIVAHTVAEYLFESHTDYQTDGNDE